MVSELTHKKIRQIFVFVVFLTIIMMMLWGCDSRHGQYPFQKAEKWLCEDPIMSLEYVQNSQGIWEFSEVLFWNNEAIAISIAMREDYYRVYPATSTHYDDRLFEGRWKYRRGSLVLKIEEDFIFNNQYSEIVLVPTTTE